LNKRWLDLLAPSLALSGIRLSPNAIVIILIATIAAHSQQAVQFSASPLSGPAPLMVTFCSSAGIAIDFGDGTISAMELAQGSDCPAGASSHVRHTYAAPGTYQVRGLPCPGSQNTNCGEAARLASAVRIDVTPTR
jgi:hypothetical protein